MSQAVLSRAASRAVAGRPVSRAQRQRQPQAPPCRALSVVCRAQQQRTAEEGPSRHRQSRRGALGLAALSAAALAGLPAGPADAFLGLGGKSAAEKYAEDTQEMIGKTQTLLAMARDDPAKPDAVAEVRSMTNAWVAKYRRDDRFAGKPSYGNMYSVLNAISGHYNSFGPEAPIPKKRLERIKKELGDADRLLTRGR